jgi:hypothetical protein
MELPSLFCSALDLQRQILRSCLSFKPCTTSIGYSRLGASAAIPIIMLPMPLSCLFNAVAALPCHCLIANFRPSCSFHAASWEVWSGLTLVTQGLEASVFFSWRIRQIWRILGNSVGELGKIAWQFSPSSVAKWNSGVPGFRQTCSQKKLGRCCNSPNTLSNPFKPC